MNVPTDWEDYDMNWIDSLALAPYEPYFVAVAEAISERATATGTQLAVSPLVRFPSPLYGMKEYAYAIQTAINTLIPYFYDPRTIDSDDPVVWTESDILTYIEAEERLTTHYYVTKEWLRQQYDILNTLTCAGVGLGRYSIATLEKAENDYDIDYVVSEYNAKSYHSGGQTTSSTILHAYIYGSELYPSGSVTGTHHSVRFTDSSALIPEGSLVNFYSTFSSGGLEFLPLGYAQEEDVYYLVASNQVMSYDAYPIYCDVGYVFPNPSSCNAGMFTRAGKKIQAAGAKAIYRPPFNFQL